MALDPLIKALSQLPGIGRRSAERIAVRIIHRKEQLGMELEAALHEANSTMCCCSQCGAITGIQADPCRLCTNPRRDQTVLCVVEEPGDVILMEKTGVYNGRYHTLMGKLSPMRGEGIENTRIQGLIKRVREEQIQEVILALNTDVESDATGSYISDALRSTGVKVTRLASGIPVGGGLSYTDPVTLSRAFEARGELRQNRD